MPQASGWYREVLNAVPAVYAGSAARLAAIVRLVCAEMGAAFAERGTVTPPWRSAQSLLSKWLPSKVRLSISVDVLSVLGKTGRPDPLPSVLGIMFRGFGIHNC